MLDGESIVRDLKAARDAGARRDDLLKRAVSAIESADDRFDWVGVYLLSGDTLVLHNYVGKPTTHERIPIGVGVCGTAVAEGRDMYVPDVTAIDNYLACSIETRSELVVLIRDGEGRILGQLDLDSHRVAAFTDRDATELRRVAQWLATTLS